jgi:hypothetical protein
MADNLCKKIGLGYLPEEPSRYDPRVIKKTQAGRWQCTRTA